MAFQLKPEQEKFIKAQVASGKYNSPIESLERGECVDSETVVAKLKEKLRQARES